MDTANAAFAVFRQYVPILGAANVEMRVREDRHGILIMSICCYKDTRRLETYYSIQDITSTDDAVLLECARDDAMTIRAQLEEADEPRNA